MTQWSSLTVGIVSTLHAHEPSTLPFPGALALGFALVVQLLAARDRELDLGAALIVEVELEWNNGHAFAFHRSGKLPNLALVEQQLARTFGRVVKAAGLQILRNIRVDEPDLTGARTSSQPASTPRTLIISW